MHVMFQYIHFVSFQQQQQYEAALSLQLQYETALSLQGLSLFRVSGDGSCLFRVVAHQVYGDNNLHSIVRQKCMDYMQSESEFFCQFVEGGKESFPFYVKDKRRDACWGDDPEIEVYPIQSTYNGQ